MIDLDNDNNNNDSRLETSYYAKFPDGSIEEIVDSRPWGTILYYQHYPPIVPKQGAKEIEEGEMNDWLDDAEARAQQLTENGVTML